MYEKFIDYKKLVRLPDNIFSMKCYTALLDICYQRWVLSLSTGEDDVINEFRSSDITHILQAYVGLSHSGAKVQFKNLHMEGFLRFSSDEGKWILILRSPDNKDERVNWDIVANNYDKCLEDAGFAIEPLQPLFKTGHSIASLTQTN